MSPSLKLRKIRYWKVTLGDDANQWEAWLTGNFVAMGWDELGDLTHLTRREFAERRETIRQRYPERTKSSAELVWRFAHHLREGDRVVVSRGAKEVLGVGAIRGAYYFVPDVYKGHCLPVEWNDLALRNVALAGWRRALVELTPEQFGLVLDAPIATSPDLAIVALPLAESSVPYEVSRPLANKLSVLETPLHLPIPEGQIGLVAPGYDLSALAATIGYSASEVARWVRVIESKGQAILYGPPGVGKTWIARELARHLVSGEDGFWQLVQFHSAYSYEDFIQGLRPQANPRAQVEFALEPGQFLRFCRQAEQSSGRSVLVIDEINRANLARVFGELLYLLEYREQAIHLAGGGPPLRVPTTVRLIGTMNTADRSIALVDHALRRRFAFIELAPNYDLIRRHLAASRQGNVEAEALVKLLQRINGQIGDKHYAIGHSFFLRPRLADELAEIWQFEIEPYLEEYFFDQPDTVAMFRWEQVRRELGQ